jgi:4-oxalocrotonate tautomerase
MPIVHVHFWEGVGQQQVKTMIRGITNVMVDLGVPEQAAEVLVHEIPKTHWGVGGEPASEKLKDISPPKYRGTSTHEDNNLTYCAILAS